MRVLASMRINRQGIGWVGRHSHGRFNEGGGQSSIDCCGRARKRKGGGGAKGIQTHVKMIHAVLLKVIDM